MWLGAIGIAVTLLGMGIFFIVMGFEAKAMIRDVTTGADAVEFGVPEGVLVADAKTAEAEAKVIKKHTFGRYGPYADMDRDDPNRATYIKDLTLRNALNLSVMGFGVANLAIGTGAVIIVLGLGTLGLAVPVLYSLTKKEEIKTPESRSHAGEEMLAVA